MQKIIKRSSVVLMLLIAVMLCLVVFGFFFVPDDIRVLSDAAPPSGTLFSLKTTTALEQTSSTSQEHRYDVSVSLLGRIPVKHATMTVSERQYAVVSGEIFGLRLYTNGVVIVSTEMVLTAEGEANPAREAGLQKGDVILQVNGQHIRSHDQFLSCLSSYDGTPFQIVFARNGKEKETTFAPAYSALRQKYMAGLWIKDSAAGIGTMTFYDKQSGLYAGLGHAVCDLETGEVLPLFEGDIVGTTINGCTKSAQGSAGELCGSFSEDRIGSLLTNDNTGVYGFLDNPQEGTSLPIATRQEVKTGEAQIVATIDNSGPHTYDAEIERIRTGASSPQDMTIRITDKKLLEKTGGIVQGMSGSPILQNGMLVGAVTHVFVNEPAEGYAIFAQTMMERARTIATLIGDAA